MIVATAGHIDHGKTSLVRALTGIDTDRLPEEKARGISIDLGFAHRICADASELAFVDVPGHERFVRNMVAGVGAVDLGLLVVAADDGIMPQTREHVAILELLQVQRLFVVLTKIDRVSQTRVTQVHQAIENWLGNTRFAAAPILAVSARTGEGIDALGERLEAEAAAQRLAASDPSRRRFRLAIDRVFSVAGSGTVVTGTVFDGVVHAGATLALSAGGQAVRVRQIQVHGRSAAQARAGQRCALNLAGVDTKTVSRGDWVLDAAACRPTCSLDVKVSVLTTEETPLAHWSPVHVHIGTAEVLARVSIARLGGASIVPGTSAYATLQLETPVAALHGDRFILRDNSGQRTLGGGVVLDPFSERTGRRETRCATLQALDCCEPEQALQRLAALPGGCVDLPRFETMMNLTAEAASSVLPCADVARLLDSDASAPGTFVVARSRLGQVHARTLAALRKWHHDHPRELGCEPRILQRASRTALPPAAFAELLQQLCAARQMRSEAGRVFLPAFDSTANPEDRRLWERVVPRLMRNPHDVPGVDLLSVRLDVAREVLEDLLVRKVRQGALIRVGPLHFYPRRNLAALAALAVELAQHDPQGEFTVAQFRDAAAIGRALATRILECLDTLGITRRQGDVRQICADPAAVLGEPTALPGQTRAKWRERHRFATQRP